MRKRATHCNSCGVELTQDNRLKVGGKCRSCELAYKKEWRQKNLDRVNQHQRDKYKADPERHKRYVAKWSEKNPEYASTWQKNNPDKVRAAKHRYYQRHKEEISDQRRAKRDELARYHRTYYAKNRDKENQRGRDYYAANKDRINARNRAHYHKDPLKHRTYWMRRRAMIRDRTAGHVDFTAILRRDGWVCHICGGLVAPGELSFDHIVPLSKGGQHSEENLAVAHLTCNKRKGARTDIASLAPPRTKR